LERKKYGGKGSEREGEGKRIEGRRRRRNNGTRKVGVIASGGWTHLAVIKDVQFKYEQRLGAKRPI
jgi:hypothetical protein